MATINTSGAPQSIRFSGENEATIEYIGQLGDIPQITETQNINEFYDKIKEYILAYLKTIKDLKNLYIKSITDNPTSTIAQFESTIKEFDYTIEDINEFLTVIDEEMTEYLQQIMEKEKLKLDQQSSVNLYTQYYNSINYDNLLLRANELKNSLTLQKKLQGFESKFNRTQTKINEIENIFKILNRSLKQQILSYIGKKKILVKNINLNSEYERLKLITSKGIDTSINLGKAAILRKEFQKLVTRPETLLIGTSTMAGAEQTEETQPKFSSLILKYPIISEINQTTNNNNIIFEEEPNVFATETIIPITTNTTTMMEAEEESEIGEPIPIENIQEISRLPPFQERVLAYYDNQYRTKIESLKFDGKIKYLQNFYDQNKIDIIYNYIETELKRCNENITKSINQQVDEFDENTLNNILATYRMDISDTVDKIVSEIKLEMDEYILFEMYELINVNRYALTIKNKRALSRQEKQITTIDFHGKIPINYGNFLIFKTFSVIFDMGNKFKYDRFENIVLPKLIIENAS